MFFVLSGCLRAEKGACSNITSTAPNVAFTINLLKLKKLNP